MLQRRNWNHTVIVKPIIIKKFRASYLNDPYVLDIFLSSMSDYYTSQTACGHYGEGTVDPKFATTAVEI